MLVLKYDAPVPPERNPPPHAQSTQPPAQPTDTDTGAAGTQPPAR
jgi:hypothetical protein